MKSKTSEDQQKIQQMTTFHSEIVLRSYQEEAVDWLSQRKAGMVIAPAGSGKTIIAAAAIARVVGKGERGPKSVKVGWLANTLEQCSQAKAALQSFPGMFPEVEYRIRCAAAQTDWSGSDVLVVDECHHASAPTWRQQIESANGAAIWGFTATWPEDEEDRQAVSETFSNVLQLDRRQAASGFVNGVVHMLEAWDPGREEIISSAIERDFKSMKSRAGSFIRRQAYSVELARFCRRQGLPVFSHEKTQNMLSRLTGPQRNEFERHMDGVADAIIRSRVVWQGIINEGIVLNQARNDAAVHAANAHAVDGGVLVLVNLIDHGQQLADRIPGSVLCHSKMGKKARAQAMDNFSTGSIPALVCTSLADEGLDLPRAGVLVLVSGGKSRTKAEQRTGRVLRKWQDKEAGLVYDFADRHHPTMRRHAESRVKLYRDLGYQILTPSQ